MDANNYSRRRLQRPYTSVASTSTPATSPKLSPFQTHLSFFASPQTPSLITLPSALKSGLRLGLNFPVSLFIAVALRILYTEFPYYWRPVDITRIPPEKWRTQLEGAPVSPDSSLAQKDARRQGYSRSELLQMTDLKENSGAMGLVRRLIDKGHVVGFWSMAADVKSSLVSVEDLQRFQSGAWGDAVAARRQTRDIEHGQVLPFTRGGPFSVAGHSWAVGRFLGVRVYEPRDSDKR